MRKENYECLILFDEIVLFLGSLVIYDIDDNMFNI